MRITSVTAEVGTTARTATRALGDFRADVAHAVEVEHDCEDSHCDIAAALRADCPLSAAHLLGGATQTPFLDAVLAAHRFNRTAEPMGADGWPPDWAEWVAYHKEHGRQCAACGSFEYEGGDTCGNCLARLDKETRSVDTYCARWNEAEGYYTMHLGDEVATSDDGEDWKDENGLGLLPSEVPDRIVYVGGPLHDHAPDGGTHSAQCAHYREEPEDCDCEGGASGE